jgi:peptidoglycan/xylan/chitin deacetylase (PgdA/CDA1 family)
LDALTGPSSKGHADLPRRQMLLAAGGMVLLGGFGSVTSIRPTAAAGRRPGQAAAAGPHRTAVEPIRPISHRDEYLPRPASHHATLVADEQPIEHLRDGHKVIALTIDDGPSPIYTPQVLRLLRKYKITASFSMIGINVVAYPKVARSVAEAGHMIVNHTWRHPNLTLLPPAAVRSEIDQATEAIHRAIGRVPDMFRAPYGAWSPAVLQRCADLHMQPLDWSVDPRDWARPGVPEIVDNIMDNTRTGSIILEHDGGGDRSQTVAALRIVIPRLLDAGYRFRTP